MVERPTVIPGNLVDEGGAASLDGCVGSSGLEEVGRTIGPGSVPEDAAVVRLVRSLSEAAGEDGVGWTVVPGAVPVGASSPLLLEDGIVGCKVGCCADPVDDTWVVLSSPLVALRVG